MLVKNRKIVEVLTVLEKIKILSGAPKGTLKIARNINALEAPKKIIDASLESIRAALFKDEITVPSADPRVPEWKRQELVVLEQESEFCPILTTKEEINYDKNYELLSPQDWNKITLLISDLYAD